MASTSAMSKLVARPVITWDKAQRIRRNFDIWKDPHSVVHRLPIHFKKRYWANILADRTPANFKLPEQRYTWDTRNNIRLEHEVLPPIVIFTKEADYGLWGGEGIVKGLTPHQPKKRRPRDKPKPLRWHAHLLFPQLMDRIFYSEIFDKYLKIRCTRRLAELVDANFGFDYYILKTPEIDLVSKLGNKLKREMLLALARQDFYPENLEKQKEILEKYGEFIIPEKEAEWIGLDLNEACKKLQDLEEEEMKKPNPLKFSLEQEYLYELENPTGAEPKPIWWQKIPGAKLFSSK